MGVTKQPSGSKSNRGTPRKALQSLATKIHEKPEQEHQGPNRKTPSNKNRGKKAGGGGLLGWTCSKKRHDLMLGKPSKVQKVKPPKVERRETFMLKGGCFPDAMWTDPRTSESLLGKAGDPWAVGKTWGPLARLESQGKPTKNKPGLSSALRNV